MKVFEIVVALLLGGAALAALARRRDARAADRLPLPRPGGAPGRRHDRRRRVPARGGRARLSRTRLGRSSSGRGSGQTGGVAPGRRGVVRRGPHGGGDDPEAKGWPPRSSATWVLTRWTMGSCGVPGTSSRSRCSSRDSLTRETGTRNWRTGSNVSRDKHNAGPCGPHDRCQPGRRTRFAAYCHTHQLTFACLAGRYGGWYANVTLKVFRQQFKHTL